MFIGGFIPGPNNPNNIDSFLLLGLQHLVLLQKEGLQIWDGTLECELRSKVFLVLLTADGPSMMHITSFVGYHGKHGCHLYCGLAGHREEHGKHYFLAILKPTNYNVEGYVHDDINIKNLPTPSHERYHQNLHYLIASPSETQYRVRHLSIGISKPSIFSGLVASATLGLPSLVGSDIMHLAMLNILDLMISLQCGMMDCTKPDDRSTWTWAIL